MTLKNSKCQNLLKETEKDVPESSIELINQISTCKLNLTKAQNDLKTAKAEN